MKRWLWVVAPLAAVAGFVVGRQMTQNNVARLAALNAALKLKSGTVVGIPGQTGVVK